MTQDVTREQVSIPGARGVLAGELAYPPGRPAYACAVFNPHPHMGGSADNPLVAAIAAAVAASGGASLRFDYAGVGRSGGGGNGNGEPVDLAASMAAFWESGRAPEDPGMVADAAAALRWLDVATNGLPLAVVGYSFGAHVAASCLSAAAAATWAPLALALISPTLTQHDFSPLLDPLAPPLLVVYADDDFATPAATTRAFLASLPRPAHSHSVAGGEHFFRGREDAVARLITDFVASSLSSAAGSPADATAEVGTC